jgi:hypothetical protein
VILDQQPAGLDNVLGLGAEKANGLYVLNQTIGTKGKDFLGRVVASEQRLSGKIYAFVGRLRGQKYRDQ